MTADTTSAPFPSDIEIAEAAEITPITKLAQERLGLPAEALIPYGHTKAKVDLAHIRSLADEPEGTLILVTAISPTPAGEGKTTTSVGLADALSRIGKKSMVALREPSMGPVFGIKGGAAGGGYAQVVPMTDINLNFTGDFASIAAANNLLSALIDNHIHHGNALGIDPRTITWKRVVDLNDRALRDIVVSLGGVANGFPREDGFDIVVASEVMAIFCLATSLADLKTEDVDALTRGMENLRKHLRNVKDVYGLPPVVAINRFPTDTDAEVAALIDLVRAEGARAYEATHFSDGGAGAEALAHGVLEAIEAGEGEMQFVYADELSLADKAEAIATKVYGAAGVTFDSKAAKRLAQIEADGYSGLPVCMAKTQSSFSTDATRRGAPTGHTVNIREVRLAAGAGFVVMVTGDIMTMPGLPKMPASDHIDIDENGNIVGLS